MSAIEQVATILLPDGAELSRTGWTALAQKTHEIAYLRPALAFKFVQKLALNLLVMDSDQ